MWKAWFAEQDEVDVPGMCSAESSSVTTILAIQLIFGNKKKKKKKKKRSGGVGKRLVDRRSLGVCPRR
jgi:hypothetical protein